ncbi:MAG: hypothetical protein AB1445_04565 [Bacillota bacterium]
MFEREGAWCRAQAGDGRTGIVHLSGLVSHGLAARTPRPGQASPGQDHPAVRTRIVPPARPRLHPPPTGSQRDRPYLVFTGRRFGSSYQQSLPGIAAWRRGFERPGIWSVIQERLR